MNVLIVDDSSLFRLAISDMLKNVKGVNSINTAANGKMAVDILESKSFDITILDVEMPVMDGIQVLREIKAKSIKTKVIMFSNLTEKGAEKTIEALNLGALDFVTKVTSDGGTGMDSIKNTLVPRIESLIGLKTSHQNIQNIQNQSIVSKPVKKTITEHHPELFSTPRILCIGSSTGGPEVLSEIFRNLRGPFPFPIVLAQHMPKFFTKKLADHLNNISSVDVVEAEHGQELKNNVAYIAPGDYHLTVERGSDMKLRCAINQDEKVCFVRPSVDVLFWSVSKLKLPHTTAIILTGMGQDGKAGCIEFNKDGYPVVIQDEESSVVWGMPGAVAEAGIQNKEADVQGIYAFINKIAGK